jgi:hypothetical protein
MVFKPPKIRVALVDDPVVGQTRKRFGLAGIRQRLGGKLLVEVFMDRIQHFI